MNEQEIFIKALEYEDRTERSSFLDSACNDNALRHRVERLLELSQKGGLAIDSPAALALSELDSDSKFVASVGEQIGPYRLLEQIGEGGMGVVYMAEQKSPVKRQVALKVIKPGMDTQQVIARFESERQALAMMEHPNIARVLDVGETETGRPFFVMELVRGVPVTEFCRRENLGIKERLQLFVQVCSAIRHSHQKGIIHRDIKPSNVMVTLHDGEPVVKMIDFGIAKALNSQLTERTLFTNFSQMIGTPLYMSPEQAEMSGLDIDTRSDIYSLGVLLYELLTGSTPFDEARLRAASYDEMRRIIREEDPPRPSVRVSTVGGKLHTVTDPRTMGPSRVSQLLRGELDWIAVKAMEKNRQRRYQTAQEFSEDIRRFLNNEPVDACPPSGIYKLRKHIARHRAMSAMIALATLLLISGTVVSIAFAVKASNAESVASDALDAAQLKAKISDGLSRFLRDDLLQASLWNGADRSVTLRKALDRAAVNFEGRYSEQPLVESEIRLTLGMAYHALNEQSTATRHLKRVYDLRAANLGESDRRTLNTLFQLALVRNSFDKGRQTTVRERAAEAALSFAAVLARQQAAFGSEDPDALVTMGHLALCYSRSERFSDANELFEKANKHFASAVPEHDQRLIDCLEQTAASLQSQGRDEDSRALQLKITNLRKKQLIARKLEHEENLVELNSLVADRERVLGEQAPQTIEANIALARGLTKSRRTDEAKSVLSKVLTTQSQLFGPQSKETIGTKFMLGKLHYDLNELEEARSFLEPLLVLEDVETQTLETLEYVAEKLKYQQRFAQAAEIHGRLAKTQMRIYGPADPRPLRSLRQEGASYVYAKKMGEVQRVADEIGELAGENHPDAVFCQLAIASEALTAGDLETAEGLLTSVFERSTKFLGATEPLTLVAGSKLTVVYQQLKQTKKAERQARQMLSVVESRFGEEHIHTMIAVCHLASSCVESNKLDEATQLCSRAASIQPLLVSNSHQRASNLRTLAETFLKARTAGASFKDDAEYHDIVNCLVKEASANGNQELADAWKEKIKP